MHFYAVAELLEAGLLEWCIRHQRAPFGLDEVTDLAVTMAESLRQQTDLPIEPPTAELRAAELRADELRRRESA
jgi:hypothetical protein